MRLVARRGLWPTEMRGDVTARIVADKVMQRRAAFK
jgi:hypothetical protein